jgi:hypothetical protein
MLFLVRTSTWGDLLFILRTSWWQILGTCDLGQWLRVNCILPTILFTYWSLFILLSSHFTVQLPVCRDFVRVFWDICKVFNTRELVHVKCKLFNGWL